MLALLAGVALLSIVLFMTLNTRGRWDFVLPFRGAKVATMVLVGYAIAVSTVLFQTVTGNRILTPSIMGFDALYALLQTTLVFFIGAAEVSAIDVRLLFFAEVLAMVFFSGLLYRWLFSGAVRGLHLLMLVGIIFGVLFRSVSNFLHRILDPNEFVVLQDRLFASFNTAHGELLAVSTLLVFGVSVIAWRLLPTFDVLALGRETAVNLGVEHRRVVATIPVIVAVLVSVSTALVGPVPFFGLLVANLAYMLIHSHRHTFILPASVLLAVIALVGGQLILERALALDTALSIVIEFVGGVFFIFLLLRGAAR